MVRLEVRRLIGNQPVPESVAFVECVIGKGFDDVEKSGTEVSVVARGDGAFYELGSVFGDEFSVFLTAGFTKIVGFGQRVASHPLCDAHHRLLVNHETVCVAENFAQI